MSRLSHLDRWRLATILDSPHGIPRLNDSENLNLV